MKDVFLVVLVTCYSTLALSYYRLPELLIYEVSEKNGEPQVNLIETQDLPVTPTYVNKNDFDNEVKQRNFIKERIHINKDPETIKLSVPPNELEYHLGPNVAEIFKLNDFKKNNNLNLKQYDLNYKKNGYKIRKNDHKVKQNEYAPVLDYISSRQNSFSPRQNVFNIKRYNNNYNREEKTKLKNQLTNILKRLEEIDESNGADSDGKIYVGTLTNKEVEDLFSVPQRHTHNYNIQRTGGFEDEILNDRTDPPPHRDIYVHDYYDQLNN